MKKIWYALIVFVLLLAGCKKNSVTLNEFIEQAKFNGYLIEENNTGYETYQYIEKVYYAVNREYAYDIQFLELSDVDYAKKFFNLNAEEIKEKITNKDYVKNINFSNYEVYHAENDNTYYLIIRSDKNVIYVTAPINYINEIEDFLKELDIDF